MDLHGRTALITGGAGHIGCAVAEALAECGASVALADRVAAAPQSAAQKIGESFYVAAVGIGCDMTSDKETSALPQQVAGMLGGLDILVNCAAFVGTTNLEGWTVPLEEQNITTWRAALEINLTACFSLSRAAVPLLKRSRHGSIINIASIYGVCGPDMRLYHDVPGMGCPAAYAAGKGGLIQLTRWLATVLAPDVRVNSISPGGVWRNQNEKFHKRYIDRVPLGRMAVEEDFKGVAAWLAGDMSAYVTGQNIMIDGGFSCW
jgi:NAD(P)-dependent dehydrogenase (short-subunit alcohol dehydrogenase family)